MRSKHKKTTLRNTALFAAILFLAVTAPLAARHRIVSHTIDGGGGMSRGDRHIVMGTLGQHDADWVRSETYELLGGFWPGGPVCIVQFDDFARFATLWLATGPGFEADLDGDNDVDFADVQELAELWLFHCPYNWPLQ